MYNLGLGQRVFRKKLTADQVTASAINIPNGIFNTSTGTCNTINCCLIVYPDNGVLQIYQQIQL